MIPVINHNELQSLLPRTYEKHLPVFVWGTFGIGKSVAVSDFGKKQAEKLGLKYSEDPNDLNDEKVFLVLKIALHQFDAAELKGIPVPNMETKQTVFFPTGMLPIKGQGIIFFDELNLAPPLVQANAYQLILDRRLGNYQVPDGFVALAAGNTIEDRAHVQEMALPLKNRFGHLKLAVPTAKEWAENFAIPRGLDQRIVNFVMGREDLLHKYNPDMMEEVYAVPTPRTWEFAAIAINGLEDEEQVERFVGMYVSSPIATEFSAWTRLAKKIDIDKIFKDKKIDAVPKEISEIYALISAVVGYYQKKMSDKKAAEYAETLTDLLPAFNAEHATFVLYQAQQIDKGFFDKLRKNCPEKLKALGKKYVKFLI